jgi:hypothetical protein
LAIMLIRLPRNKMALTSDANEVLPPIWCWWYCKNSRFRAISVCCATCMNIKEESAVLPPVQLKVALVMIPIRLPWKRNDTPLWLLWHEPYDVGSNTHAEVCAW